MNKKTEDLLSQIENMLDELSIDASDKMDIIYLLDELAEAIDGY
tara:strand:+ start:547 stop:678 length:132 start_codon:yes stop_codon:yes gene_type:complete